MKDLLRLLFFAICIFISSDLWGQLKAGNEGIYIKGGTTFSTDGLVIIPVSDLTIISKSVIRGDETVNWTQLSSIKRMYHFSSPIVFRGIMSLNYLDSELNGNNSADLRVAYTAVSGSNNSKDYIISNNSIVNLTNRYITENFEGSVNISNITAVATGFFIPPIIPSSSPDICEGSSVMLSTVPALAYQWFRNGIQLAGSTGRDLIVNQSGDYVVQTILSNGITTTSDPFTVTVNPAPAGEVVSDKEVLSLGDIATLKASGGTTYLWEAAEEIINGQNTDSLTVRPSKTTTYRVRIGNGSGCTTIKSITVEVAEDYKALIPNNLITPNGDGKNDVWVVKNIDMYPNNEVTITDRSGRVVYTKNGYNNTWDATSEGNPLPEDTYYYILYINSGKGKLTGFISVVKE